MGNLAKNWPVYILLAGFIWFVVSVYRHAWREEKKKQEQESSKKGKGV